LEEFSKALDDDFNTEKALAVIHSFKTRIMINLALGHKPTTDISHYKDTYKKMIESFLGIPLALNNDIPENIENLLIARQIARKEKNWLEADKVRNELDKLGYKAIDNPDGTSTGVKK
jgi:cysteinyl-tRNA synthetase